MKKIYSGLSYSVYCEIKIDINQYNHLIYIYLIGIGNEILFILLVRITILSGVAPFICMKGQLEIHANKSTCVYKPTNCTYFSPQIINNKTH